MGASHSAPDACISSAPALWQPSIGASWQIVLLNPLQIPNGAAVPNVQVWDFDMFDAQNATVKELKKEGKNAICYFSAGSYEPNRPDSSEFTAADKGKELDGWPGEYWLNISSPNVRKIMTARIGHAAALGCDAIDPDNVDGYDNDNGLGLTPQDSINYIKFLSSEAKKRGLATGLKNAGGIIEDVLPDVHFSVNEQCHAFQECETYASFIAADKPVFNIEYPPGADKQSISAANRRKYCARDGKWGTGAANFSTVLKKMSLDGWVEFCDGKTATTPVTTS